MCKRYEIAFSTPNPVALAELHAIIGKYLAGYSLQTAEGAWEGAIEHSYLVSLVTDIEAHVIESLALELKEAYHQQCVLVSSWDVSVAFI